MNRSSSIAVLMALAVILLPARVGAQVTFVGEWGSQGTGQGQFEGGCQGIAVGPDGSVYVTDTYRVQRFTAQGSFLRAWNPLHRDGQTTGLRSLAVSPAGLVYVATSRDNSIQVFTPEGNLVRRWGVEGVGVGQFSNAIDIDFGPDGDVYVTDFGRNRILRFRPDSTFVGEFGAMGSGLGQFHHPGWIAFAPSGRFYVTDYGNSRVQQFTTAGTALLAWGEYGYGDSQFRNMTGIAVDGAGGVYVADGFNNRVQKFTGSGTFLFSWGAESEPGAMDFPVSVAFGLDGTIYVAGAHVWMYRDVATPAANSTWGAVKARYR